MIVRPLRPKDREQWQPLWDGYNAFYGREGATALPMNITKTTWDRFFDANEHVRYTAAAAVIRLSEIARRKQGTTKTTALAKGSQ